MIILLTTMNYSSPNPNWVTFKWGDFWDYGLEKLVDLGISLQKPPSIKGSLRQIEKNLVAGTHLPPGGHRKPTGLVRHGTYLSVSCQGIL